MQAGDDLVAACKLVGMPILFDDLQRRSVTRRAVATA